MLLDTSNPGAKSVTAALVAGASVGAEPPPTSRAGRALGRGLVSSTLASLGRAPVQTRCPV